MNARRTQDTVELKDATLFLPRKKTASGGDSRAGRSLPPELKEQAAQRLRLIALTYSAVFILADYFPAAVMGVLSHRFRDPMDWLPTILSIVTGLVVAFLAGRERLSWETKVNLGLVFQVAGSYGIAFAMYFDVPRTGMPETVFHVLSPSWVGVWMLFYTILVPSPPGRALIALLGSASAAPFVIGWVMRESVLDFRMPPGMFFFMHVFPYLICAAMAYLGARVVYRLGTDVSRARELGSYQLVERLGQGGMGEVWRATHHMLARQAAIKFIRPEAISGSSPEEAQLLLKRFELEARATASLSSAHTIDLYDFGVTDDGRFYYVMELLDGLDCEELVRRFGPLAGPRVVHLLRQVCQSLDEAHGKGMIHRDVKPANIYVCRSGRVCDFVKVLDFGLVAHGTTERTDARLTQPDQAVGTPAYMPPEMALGKSIDARADLYGIGCVAYWLVTGRPVFDGSFYEVVSKHLHATPDPPSQHAPHPLPSELDALILRCLEKDPARRPASARDLELALRRVPFVASWSDESAEEWWRANLQGVAKTQPAELAAV
jgi:eukaryotic-like serine/threonine-protein kinase